jgi:hypothetical protein
MQLLELRRRYSCRAASSGRWSTGEQECAVLGSCAHVGRHWSGGVLYLRPASALSRSGGFNRACWCLSICMRVEFAVILRGKSSCLCAGLFASVLPVLSWTARCQLVVLWLCSSVASSGTFAPRTLRRQADKQTPPAASRPGRENNVRPPSFMDSGSSSAMIMPAFRRSGEPRFGRGSENTTPFRTLV